LKLDQICFSKAITHPRLPALLALVAALLCLPALWVGFQWDDYAHQVALHQFPETRQLTPSPLFLFSFADGDIARNHRLMEAGWLPWWCLENLRMAFFRPLTALTHWMDHLLWPNSPILMHVHSLIWFGLLVYFAAILYRQIMGMAWIAGMAAFLFAFDDAHGVPAGWIANRNALIASVFVILTLIFHDLWRKNSRISGAVIAPIFFLCGLLAGELALAGTGYLLAYAVFLDRGTWIRRFVSLVPYGVVGVLWLVMYRIKGFGAFGSHWYVDPIRDPGEFFLALFVRAPILLMGQLGFISSDIYMTLSVSAIYLLWGISVIFLIILFWGIFPVVKSNPQALFWACGMLLAIPLVCTTFPFDRLMLLSGLGATGLLAIFLKDAVACNRFTRLMLPIGDQKELPKISRQRSFTGVLAVFIIGVHLIISPLSLPARAWSAALLGKMIRNLHRVVPADAILNQQDLVIVNSPASIIGGFFLSAVRLLNGESIPRRVRVLSSTIHSVEITRKDLYTLVIRPKGGYLDYAGAVHSKTDPKTDLFHMGYIYQQMDRTFRGTRYPFDLGHHIDLNGLSITISELTLDGRPAVADFRFSVPLEDPSLRWLQWQKDTLIPFSLPSINETRQLPAPELAYW
jgi:hypothetical protein